jgi:hypothetical protein
MAMARVRKSWGEDPSRDEWIGVERQRRGEW